MDPRRKLQQSRQSRSVTFVMSLCCVLVTGRRTRCFSCRPRQAKRTGHFLSKTKKSSCAALEVHASKSKSLTDTFSFPKNHSLPCFGASIKRIGAITATCIGIGKASDETDSASNVFLVGGALERHLLSFVSLHSRFRLTSSCRR